MSAMQENVERWVNDTLHGDFESLCVSEGNESCNSSKLSAQQFDDDRRNFRMVKEYFDACQGTIDKENGEDHLKHFLDVVFQNGNKSAVDATQIGTWEAAVVNMSSMGLSTFVSMGMEQIVETVRVVATKLSTRVLTSDADIFKVTRLPQFPHTSMLACRTTRIVPETFSKTIKSRFKSSSSIQSDGVKMIL